MANKLDALRKLTGSSASNETLTEALTHSSSGKKVNYQRMEFLGDRVLGLVIAEFLIKNFPDENEGNLARRLSYLVDKNMLARVAIKTGIGEFIIMSEAEKSAGGSENDNLLSDVMEALIGATFLDSGLEECKKIILTLWGDFLYETLTPPIDPKTALQEWTQGKGLGLPDYELADRQGPDHAPTFEIKVNIEGHGSISAKGTSRRSAEKSAAKKMLHSLKNANPENTGDKN